MPDWSPVAILPNLSAREAVEGEIVAVASYHDPRVQAFCVIHPKFRDFLSRFTDAFRVPLEPAVFIVRDDMIPRLAQTQALVSFRDVVAMCVVPYARSLTMVYGTKKHRIVYSNSFWLYPWMFNTDIQRLTASTLAIEAVHVVEKFHGQSAPELSVMALSDLDEPLFKVLLPRWRRHYLGKRQRWRDRALFRSLNMAAQAAHLPAGVGTTLYDLGRMVALWVSAFEILAHPGVGYSGLLRVYRLFEDVSYLDNDVGRRRYAEHKGQKKPAKPMKPRPRRSLPCWLYGKLNQARNDFIHGNPVTAKSLDDPKGSKESLFWLAPSLYRLALTGFLGGSSMHKHPKEGGRKVLPERTNTRIRWDDDYQGIIERALLRARK